MFAIGPTASSAVAAATAVRPAWRQRSCVRRTTARPLRPGAGSARRPSRLRRRVRRRRARRLREAAARTRARWPPRTYQPALPIGTKHAIFHDDRFVELQRLQTERRRRRDRPGPYRCATALRADARLSYVSSSSNQSQPASRARACRRTRSSPMARNGASSAAPACRPSAARACASPSAAYARERGNRSVDACGKTRPQQLVARDSTTTSRAAQSAARTRAPRSRGRYCRRCPRHRATLRA